MIRLSGQRASKPGAVRSAPAARSAAAGAEASAAGREASAAGAEASAAGGEALAAADGELAGLSCGPTFTSVMVIRGRETQGQDGQVVVQVSSVELADTIDHLVKQLLTGPVQGTEGLPDQVHQAFAAEPL